MISNVEHKPQCTEEAHRPVDCSTVAKWILKNSAESENMNWYGLYFMYLTYAFVLGLIFLLPSYSV